MVLARTIDTYVEVIYVDCSVPYAFQSRSGRIAEYWKFTEREDRNQLREAVA